MTNVIGYKATAQERRANWLYMLGLKEAKTVFTDLSNKKEQAMRKRDLASYDKYVKQYVGKEAA